MVKTGSDGQLKWKGKAIGKIKSWTLNVNKELIDDSCLGATDRTFVPGLRTVTGSCNVLYDPEDATATNMLNNIWQNGKNVNDLEFVFNRSSLEGRLRCPGYITDLSMSVNVGAAIACEISFTVSGDVEGKF